MNIKTGQELKKYIELKIKDKYQRSYVDYFYHKLLNEKFYYVLYGFRRIGKSTLCFQILDKFITNNIYCVNEIGFIDIELEISLGKTVNNIKQYIFEIIKQNKIKLLFLDEIQIIDDWDLFLKSLHDHFNNVKIIEFKSINKLLGDKNIEGVELIDTNTKDLSTLNIDGIFVYIGQLPPTDFLKPLGILNTRGFIEVDSHFETPLKGIYAIGDCINKDVRQIVTAVGDAASAIHYINE